MISSNRLSQLYGPGKRSLAFALICSILTCLGCVKTEPQIEALVIGYGPSDPTFDQRKEAYSALADYLASALERPVELVEVAEYDPTIEALKSGRVDMCAMGSMAFLRAESMDIARGLLMRFGNDASQLGYHSLFMVPASSKLESVEDVQTASENIRVAWADSKSTSGYLVPNEYLHQMNLDAESFADVSFTGSHALSVFLIENNEVDLAAVSEPTYASLVQSQKVDPDKIRVIWRSPAIPTGPIVVRSELDSELCTRIAHAMVTMPQASPEHWRTYTSQYSNPSFRFVHYQPSIHEELRAFLFE